MVTNQNIAQVIQILREAAPHWSAPVITEMVAFGRDPYLVLIACLLSLRTKDTTTGPAARRLFELADTPSQMVTLQEKQIETIIYPVGFYRNKAKIVRNVSQDLLDRFQGQVPSTLDELLTLKGVGRKTANLVLTLGYRLPGICVDTHVHRISNRWGYVKTKNPDETEIALRKKLPHQFWIEFNDHLVALGQTICHPVSPKCSHCPVAAFCAKINVARNR